MRSCEERGGGGPRRAITLFQLNGRYDSPSDYPKVQKLEFIRLAMKVVCILGKLPLTRSIYSSIENMSFTKTMPPHHL